MRLIVNYSNEEKDQKELFAFLVSHGGNWSEIPEASQLGISGGHPLTDGQLAAVVDSSMQSPTSSLDDVKKRVEKRFNAS